ncbi:MAG: polyprenol monophosphomannose synthase [bacterium]
MKVLVIVPTYNERENVAAVVRGILEFGPGGTDVLIVDDSSPDGTGELADELAEKSGRVSVLHRPSKSGLGSAYLDGFRRAVERGYDAAVELDADGSHDPADLVRLVAAVRDGVDLSIGSRRVPGARIEGWGIGRHIVSWCASSAARIMLGLGVRDASSGFRCLSRRATETLLASPLRSSGYAFQEESLFWLQRSGCRAVELPVVFRNRTAGRSKADWREAADLIRILFRLSQRRRFRG